MILHLTKDILKFEKITHPQDVNRNFNVLSVIQSEVFFYKNNEVTVRVTMKIIEHNFEKNNFEVMINSYAHVHPELIRVEFSDSKKIGMYNSLEEATFAAQTYFNHHHHVNFPH